MELVLDTNVLGIAFGNGETYPAGSFDALSLLMKVHREDSLFLAVDHEGEILEEYKRRALSNRMLTTWLGTMRQKGKFMFYCNQPPACQSRELERMSFHSKDRKFVGVALNGSINLIVVEADSDWNNNVKQYLFDECGIQVVNSAGCLQIT